MRIHEHLWQRGVPVVGMIHLLPLPGAPRYGGSMANVIARARQDACRLVEGGVDGLIVENYGDSPFFPGPVPPSTLTAMAAVVSRVTAEVPVPVGVNVLRNDAAGALAVAASCEARFIRVNVHTGSMFTDQGLLHGQAHLTLRDRQRLCPDVAILADVFVKHATPPPGISVMDAARDTWLRGLADGLILTGSATGRPLDPDGIPGVRNALPDAARLWAGSGVNEGNVGRIAPLVDGMIIGSAFQQDGVAGREVEEERVRGVLRALGRA